jgi:hypothetical protein
MSKQKEDSPMKSTITKEAPPSDPTKSTTEPQPPHAPPTLPDERHRGRDVFAELDMLAGRVSKLEGQLPVPRVQPEMCQKCGGPVTGGVLIGEKHYHAGCAPTGTGR